MKISKTLAAVAGAGLVVAGLMTVSPASADPIGTPAGASRALAGVGSDTTQNVLTDLSEIVTIGGVKQIASWDATGSGSFTTRATLPAGATNCDYTRAEANGSTNGRNLLLASLQAGNARTGCLDFARSSSSRGTFTSTPSMTWIPFAKDASSYLVRADGNVPRALTLAEVQGVFKCQNTPDIWPVLPQPGSGSRAFWLTQMGITETQISTPGTYPCLVPVGTAGFTAAQATGRAYTQENSGTTLKVDEMASFSIGLFNVQATGDNADVRGFKNVLGKIGGVLPNNSNPNSVVSRLLFNVVPTSQIGTAPTSTVFVGQSSLVCQATATIAANGFAPLTATTGSQACGDTSSQS